MQISKTTINICVKLKIYIGKARWHDWWIVRIIEHHISQVYLSLNENPFNNLGKIPNGNFFLILHNVDKVLIRFHIFWNHQGKYQVLCFAGYRPTIYNSLNENQWPFEVCIANFAGVYSWLYWSAKKDSLYLNVDICLNQKTL